MRTKNFKKCGRPTNNGLFVVIEGADGAGKTTVAKLLTDKLSNLGYDAVYTREPGGNKSAEAIREIFKNDKNLSNRTRTLLAASARALNVDSIIIPAMNSKKIVICDRYCRSTFIYQDFFEKGRHEKESWYNDRLDTFESVMNYATRYLYPDIEFTIDVSAETSYERTHEDGRDLDSIEDEDFEWYNKIAKEYKKDNDEFFAGEKENIHYNSDKCSAEEIANAMIKDIEDVISRYEINVEKK